MLGRATIRVLSYRGAWNGPTVAVLVPPMKGFVTIHKSGPGSVGAGTAGAPAVADETEKYLADLHRSVRC